MKILFSLIALFLLSINSYSVELMSFKYLSSYQTGLFDVSAAEICAFDSGTNQLYLVNANSTKLVVLDINNPSNPLLKKQIDLSQWGNVANSVDVYNGLVAVAVESNPKTDNGKVIFFNSNGDYLNHLMVGALPDMLSFSPDGNYVAVCNEGEPNDDYTIDPEGAVSIIDLRNGVANATVRTADFKSFIGLENELRAQGIRIFGPNANAAQDIEPEYLTIEKNSHFAYVTLQENNAIATVDLHTAKVISIKPLGYKNHNLIGNEIDPSDKDKAINIKNWPVFGMFMPDGLSNFEYNGNTYIITANEGDSRAYSGYDEEARVKNLNLNPLLFPDAATLQKDANLGRLTVSTSMGDKDKDGIYDSLYAFGGRSFSIFDINCNLIYDSGSEFEKITAERYPTKFNSGHTNNTFENRSDNKGPEPESVIVEKIKDQLYAFIALERIGGVMVYNISNPAAPYFVNYFNHRNLEIPFPSSPTPEDLVQLGDLGPESIKFIPASISPNNHNLMIVANEISGSVSFFQVIMAPEVNLSNKSACKLNPIQLANIDEYGVDNSVLYGSGDYQYEWSYPSLLNNANSENPYYLSPISSRTFTLKISDNQTGLSATGTMNVVVNSVATFSLPVSVRHPKNTSLDLTTLPTGVTGTMPFNYIWTNQSGNVIIDPTDVIPALGFNKYYLTIQDANGCYSANKRVIVYVSPLSKEGTYQDNLVNSQNGSGFAIFYPVPADNELNIISEFDTENQLFIEIYDLNGKKVINETRNFSTQNTTLNISNVSSGAYTIILRCGEDIIYGNIIKK